MKKHKYTSAVLLAAGSGTRFSPQETKQMIKICGLPVFIRTALAFHACSRIDEIVLVVKADEYDTVRDMCAQYNIGKLTAVVVGGKTRQESARIGAEATSKKTKFIAIHDAARCLITTEMIDSVLDAAYIYRSAAAACRCVDTIKVTDANGFVSTTVDRDLTWRVFTPQVFEKNLYIAAAYMAKRDEAAVTDDCSLIERIGGKVKLIDVGDENLKLTHPSDRDLAEFILKKRGEMS
ncbi:MAG: 2-C-methyl-D-erythritol 4-phosphate cytidylyltransferase [Clostridia bacterium]|nr:2-C-methyl-D-erythritol 4-phosphate cytidylyltransferase [Clostridia bacterium]